MDSTPTNLADSVISKIGDFWIKLCFLENYEKYGITQITKEPLYAYKKLDASAVMVNEHTAFRVDWMPFAGLRESGLGIGGIPHTFRDMQIEKMIVIHSKSLE